MLKSWQTTVAGVIAFLGVAWPQIQLWFDGLPETNPDLTVIAGALAVLFGFAKARDNNVSSEDAGAK